jgi:hypothetical protein
MLLTWSPSPTVTAQDDLVLHTYPYSATEIDVLYETRPEFSRIDPEVMPGPTTEDQQNGVAPQLEIRASQSQVAAVWLNVAWRGETEGCGNRLWYSADSTAITPQGDGTFRVAMKGFWSWDVTSRPGGLTQGICSEKAQTTKDFTATLTVSLESGSPVVTASTDVAVPERATTAPVADQSPPGTTPVEPAGEEVATEPTTDIGSDVPSDTAAAEPDATQTTEQGGQTVDRTAADANGGSILVIALLLTLLMILVALGIAGTKGYGILRRAPKALGAPEWEDEVARPLDDGAGEATPTASSTEPDDMAAKVLLTNGLLDLAAPEVPAPPSEPPPGELPTSWRWVWAPRPIRVPLFPYGGGTNTLEPGRWYKAHPNVEEPTTWDVYEADDNLLGQQISMGHEIRDGSPSSG